MNTQRNLTVIPVLKETGPSPVEVGYHHKLILHKKITCNHSTGTKTVSQEKEHFLRNEM